MSLSGSVAADKKKRKGVNCTQHAAAAPLSLAVVTTSRFLFLG